MAKQQQAGAPKRTRKPKEEASAPALTIETGAGLCACGCGESPAGKRAEFKQGHDARLRGILGRHASQTIRVIRDGEANDASGASLLDQRGWPQPPTKKSKAAKPKQQTTEAFLAAVTEAA